jgi:hypothetical protein
VRTVFLRALEAEDKAQAIRSGIRRDRDKGGARLFELDPESFSAIPNTPFVYWVSDHLRQLFRELPPFAADGRTARVGVQTGDDARYVRVWWAVTTETLGLDWFNFAKGGSFSPFYVDSHRVVNWAEDGSEIRGFRDLRTGRLLSRPQGTEFYLRPGLTWPLRGARFSAQAVGGGGLFDVAGKMAFLPSEELSAFHALMNSAAFSFLIRIQSDAVRVQYQAGLIGSTPVPDLGPADRAALAALARRAWSLKRSLDTRTETSHAFVLPALLQVGGESLAVRSSAWTERVRAVEAEVAAIQAEVDERCFELYGIDDEDRRAITEGFGGSETSEQEADAADADLEEEAEAAADAATLAAELVSWAVGVAFGRFDVRLATGARALPSEPEPFDPLPLCSAAMLTGDDGLPLESPPAGYPLSFPEDGVLVDDPGHPRDLTNAVRGVFYTVFGPRADAVWQEAAALLDPRDHDLRNWLASGFFEHHLKQHSKSRRKAPILWQLGVPSGRYSIWLYAHRLTRDSLFALARDTIAPKLDLEERRRTSLVQDGGPNPPAKQRADIAAQDAIVDELRVFADEVRRVAPLWNPDLDDGIVLVMATLWRLVPGHKGWQKELKSRWDELVAGKFDWAHIAMHLWPERVVPKCAADRSLAIAHGLEDVFWVEGAEGKWLPRPTPTTSIDELVAERASPAVKAALSGLLGATGGAEANGGRGRRGRISPA